MPQVEITIPAQTMDALERGLIRLTAEIDERDADAVAHGFLGGAHGYGAHMDTPVFSMRPYYWGDCDCGADDRSEAWWAAHPHADDCYQSELRRRMDAYDERVGYKEIESAAFGGNDTASILFGGMDTQSEPIVLNGVEIVFSSIMTPRKDEATERWRKAHDARGKFEEQTYRALAKIFGTDPKYGAAVHCTCGVDKQAAAYFETESHYDTCAVELPNFLHKPSGLEVRWYKYIGRGMDVRGAAPANLGALIDECVASLPSPPDKD